MFLIKCVLCFILCILVGLGLCLVTLPEVEENNIINAESVIRTTVNSLFSNLRIRKVRDKPRLKQYSVAHNYFVSLTLQDYNSLKEIAKLTRVVKNNSTNIDYYISLINEILDEDNVHKLQSIILGEHETPEYDIEGEKVKLESLKKYHEEHKNTYTDINEEVLKILLRDGSLELNNTNVEDKNIQESSENVLDDLPVWHEDVAPSSGRRLFNSKQTKIKKFPFMASVQIFNKFQCGGSIIKSDLVITSASCLQLAWNNRFYRENPAFLSVRVGSSFYEIGGEQIGVLEVYFHPGYNPKNLHNNLAVMRLVRLIRMKRKKKKVKKILLDDTETNLPLNVMDGVEILGWGAHTRSNKLNGPWEDKLRHETLGVYPLDDCQDVYSKEYVTHKNFCAGTVSVGSGACNRDVGGPGIVSGKLTGVISFGAPACGTPDAPTVFTKIGYYYDWIEGIMEQDVPNIRYRTTSLPRTFPYAPPSFYSPPHRWTLLPLITSSFTPNLASDTGTNDKILFKDFLRTMFKSAEIEEYFDSMKSIVKTITQPQTQTTMDAPTTQTKEVQRILLQNSFNNSSILDLTTTNGPFDYLTKPNSIVLENIIVLPNNADSRSSISSEEKKSSFSTVVTSNQTKSGSIKSADTLQDLVMEYDTDSSEDIKEQKTKLHFRDQTTENILSAKSEMLQTSVTKSNISVNEKIDNALLALLYLSDSERERMEQQNKPKIVDYDDRKNIPEMSLAAVPPVPFKDLTYRLRNQDKIETLRKLLSDDMIIEFLKDKIVNNKPLLELNEATSKSPQAAPVALATPVLQLI